MARQFHGQPADFQFKTFSISPAKPYVNWQVTDLDAEQQTAYRSGVNATFESSLPELQGVDIAIHYVLYDEFQHFANG